MQGLDNDSTFKQLMYSYKGSVTCAKERAEFALCRASPQGALGEPEICEAKTASFMQCYHNM